MTARYGNSESGFSLAELLVATTLLLIISGVVTSAVMQLTNSQKTIWNRTEMHGSVRSATELLQQEVGQAGRIALPGSPTLTAALITGATTVTVSSVSGIFPSEYLLVDTGALQEIVVVNTVNAASNTFTISKSVDYTGAALQTSFVNGHASGAPISVVGGFQSGIVPPGGTGSSGSTLKMFGDINGDGNMVYIAYSCDTTNNTLYRRTAAFNAATLPGPTSDQALLSNITINPPVLSPVPCFQYQMDPSNTFVLDVAVTLTINSQQIDPVTKQLQTETKALLNVSPRNIINAWQNLAQYPTRVQPTPSTVTNLIGQ